MNYCLYFKAGYFGVCNASESYYVPSIAEMEQYCFKEDYRFCPIFKVYSFKKFNKTGTEHFIYSSHYKEEGEKEEALSNSE